MEKSSRYHARREVLQQIAPQYSQASAAQKRTLLEAFIAATGHVPKYARWLLNHAQEVQQVAINHYKSARYNEACARSAPTSWKHLRSSGKKM